MTGLLNRLKYGLMYTVLILLFLLVVLWNHVVYTVPPGYGGVVWHSLRSQFIEDYAADRADEGITLVLPWDKFYLYDLRLQAHTETYQVVSREGLHFEVDMTFRWKVLGANIVKLNQDAGSKYLQTMLIPEVGSILRLIVANYPAEALYTTERNAVQQQIYDMITSASLPNHIGPRDSTDTNTANTIILQDALVTSIRLPPSLKDAIERKLSEAQQVEQYRFIVQKEQLESERKQIEAEGIRNFQETVAPAITDSYLQWRGIEATIDLARSDNAKIVVIGNSQNGLPLILDSREATAEAANDDAPDE